MFVSGKYFPIIVSFWDLILNPLKCMCLSSLLQYRRLSMMACSSSGDYSPSWTLTKSNRESGPSVATVRSFSSVIKIIRSGVTNHTPNSQPGGPGYHFSSESPPLTSPDPSSSYASPAISFRIILFLGNFGTMPNRFTSKFRNIVIALDLTLSSL